MNQQEAEAWLLRQQAAYRSAGKDSSRADLYVMGQWMSVDSMLQEVRGNTELGRLIQMNLR